MQNVLNHVSDKSSHLNGKRRKKTILNFPSLIRGSYFTTLSYDVVHDVFVLFTLAVWHK